MPTGDEPRGRWTAWSSIWLAVVGTSIASLGVLWGLSWSGAEDAVSAALADQLLAEAALIGEHLRDVPVDVLAGLGSGHGTDAFAAEVARFAQAAGLHDAAVLGPNGVVLGSGGEWLLSEADADLLAAAPASGPLYRGYDGALYLAAYSPLPGRPEWVVAVEGSATLGAVDRLARRQAAASALVLVTVGGLAWWVATLVARPLRSLERQIASIVPGDPPDRIDGTGPREIAAVARAAQRLLAAIRERDAAVLDAHRQQVEHVTRLAAAVAHEVRNPLNAMSLSIERMTALADGEQRRTVGLRLLAQVEELEAMVGRLLDLTRPVTPRAERVDLRPLVRSVAEEVDVPIEILGAEQSVDSDPLLVAQVVRNLALNAKQAGAQTLTVTLEPGALVVADDGPGLSDPDSAFDWFATTRARGSGLGLPLSRRIAQALGGRLELLSARPATFRFTLREPR